MGFMLRKEPPILWCILATDVISAQKQYMGRIKKWGLNKHIQTEEMEAMIRKKRECNTKQSAFRRRGRRVISLAELYWLDNAILEYNYERF
jgi:hypothetical protein